MSIVFILLLLFIFFVLFKLWKKFKFPKMTALTVFTGAVKVGKTGVSLACAINLYKKVRRRWKFKKFFQALFRKPISEEPLFYSNIPLATFDYCKLTTDHILRKVRFNYKSVVFVDESALLADSQLIKEKDLNQQLLEFFKLFGHETHCGYGVFNSQCLTDLHYALRRCTSQYFYIHHTSKHIPFVCVASVREERYSEDGTTINTYSEDVEESLKLILFRKNTFKKYDCCCYSSLTDWLPTKNVVIYNAKKDNLKAEELISFRPELANIFQRIENQKKYYELEKECSSENE